MPTKRDEVKSKYTIDRQIPGAFEGETVTRRRFMTGAANGAGMIATAAILLPSLGFAIGPIFKEVEVPWQTIGVLSDFSETNYIPMVITAVPGIGEAGNTTVVRAAAQPAARHGPVRPGHPGRRDLQPLRASRLPRALGERR